MIQIHPITLHDAAGRDLDGRAAQLSAAVGLRLAHQVEEGIRRHLISLGWTPPPDRPRAAAAGVDETRLRVRANDPGTSVAAAEAAASFSARHRDRILEALGVYALSSHQIAARSGLTVVQVDRRLPELRRDRLIEPLLDEAGDQIERHGYRVWRKSTSA